jgi:hypothetical protein
LDRHPKLLALVASLPLLLALAGCAGNKNATLPIPVEDDFTLAVTPATATLDPGGAGQALVVTANAAGVFNSQVSVTISGLPAGTTATPATLTLTPGKAQNVILTALSAAAATSATVTLTGTSGSLTHAATVALTVDTPPPPQSFSLSASPVSAIVTAGSTTGATIAVSATAINGFSGTVAVALTGLPQGVVASPANLSLVPGTPQNVSLTSGVAAAPGVYTVKLIGTSASLTQTSTVALTVDAAPPPRDFSLSINPTAQTLTAGNATGVPVAVTATALNGLTGSVTVALTGLPAGVTASPASLTLTPGTPQNVTLTAASTAIIGTSTVTFTGTSGALTHTAPLALTVAAAPDFSLSIGPTARTLTAGATGAPVAVSVTALNGLTGSVTVALTGLPAGVTANPANLTLTPGAPQNITLTAASTAAAGTATVTFTGTSGALIHTTPLALTVDAAPPPPGFSFSINPTSRIITAGATGATIAVSATAINGFTGTVAVALSGLPAGVTANPASLTLTPGTPQNITLTAASTAIAGTSTVTFTGTSGALTHTAPLALTVDAAPNFSLSINPTSRTLTAGATGEPVAVTATALNGFTGTVTVALTGLPAGVTANPATLILTPGTPQNITLTAASTATAGTSTVTFTGTSGALTHTAPLALTVVVPPPPDFELSILPTAQTITIGTTGGEIAVTATALNGLTGNVKVALSGLPTGVTANPATLTLTPGTAQDLKLTVGSTATAGSHTVTFTGTSGTLTHTTPLALTIQAKFVPDVTTYHYDNTRQGLNAQETILTPANVNSTKFGKVGFYTTDGKVDAQPLFAANVTVSSTVTENLVYVATEHDSVYAFAPATGDQVWKTSVLAAGETRSDDHGCSQITPEIGITSTPVIDRSRGPNGAIFVVGMTKDSGGNYHQRLHALDLATGAELSGSPTEIAATYPGTGDNSSNGVVTFDPAQYAERAGLLLLNGTIYLGWTSHCDYRPYTGWVMGYSESTLKQTTVLDLTPNGYEGSVWMAGFGMAADTSGNIYFLDANGAFSGNFNANGFPLDDDYGNAMIKLSTTDGKLAVADYFQPYNTIYESSVDADLGSGGAILIPNVKNNAGTVYQLLVGAGKDDNIYVANTANMGKFNQNGSSNSNLYQELTDALVQGAWSGPAYFNNTVYYGSQGDVLKAFPISNAKLATTPSSKSAITFTYPGTTPSVSANGTSNGIVWAMQDCTCGAAALYAFDATNLANLLYDSNQAAGGRDSFGTGNKFITPVVVNGNVYVGTPTGVAVFGLLPP